MKFVLRIIAIILACCSWAIAQTNGTATQTVTNGASAVVYNNAPAGTNTSGAESTGAFRQYPGAYGVIGTPAIPGYPLQNGSGGVLFLATWKGVAITANQQKTWLDPLLKDKKRIKEVKIGGTIGQYPTNQDPIVLVDYDPGAITYPGDRIISRVTYICQPDDVLESCYGTPLAVAKQKIGIHRAAILFQWQYENETNGKASAGGVAIAGMIPNGTGSATIGIGRSHGKTVTKVNGRLAIQVVCMNDIDPQVSILAQQQAPTPPTPENNQKKDAPPQPQASAPPQPAAPPTAREHTYTLEELERLRSLLVPPNPPTPTPTPTPIASPAPAPQASSTGTGIPQLTVWFNFEKSNIDRRLQLKHGDFEAKLKAFVAWAKANPQFKLEVEGHTCRMGSMDLNWKLGGHRADALYDLLIQEGIPPTQLQPASFGKGVPSGSEILDDDRRAVVHIQGEASGK